jgi:galactonate dehydratase
VIRLRPVIVGVAPKTNWSFVVAETDDGLAGVGECSLNGWEPLLAARVRMREREFAGLDEASIFVRLRILPHCPGGLVAHAVDSAIEQALVDIAAKRAGVPVHRLLAASADAPAASPTQAALPTTATGRAAAAFAGEPAPIETRPRRAIPVYANVNRATRERTPAGFADSARRAVAAGFRAVKLAPFDGVIAEDAASTPIAERIRAGIDRVYAVRDAIGPELALMVDCHWRFDEPLAHELVASLAGANLFWLECPISEHFDRWPAIARLRTAAQARGMRLAGAETVADPAVFAAMARAGLYDVIMPDVKYAGGFHGMLAAAGIAAAHGIGFAPHNPTGPVANAASLHVCALAPTLVNLELQVGESPLFDALVGGRGSAPKDGAFALPESPGLGVELDEAVAAAHPGVEIPPGANLDPRLG